MNAFNDVYFVLLINCFDVGEKIQFFCFFLFHLLLRVGIWVDVYECFVDTGNPYMQNVDFNIFSFFVISIKENRILLLLLV